MFPVTHHGVEKNTFSCCHTWFRHEQHQQTKFNLNWRIFAHQNHCRSDRTRRCFLGAFLKKWPPTNLTPPGESLMDSALSNQIKLAKSLREQCVLVPNVYDRYLGNQTNWGRISQYFGSKNFLWLKCNLWMCLALFWNQYRSF